MFEGSLVLRAVLLREVRDTRDRLEGIEMNAGGTLLESCWTG
jgi:hypothetical protein